MNFQAVARIAAPAAPFVVGLGMGATVAAMSPSNDPVQSANKAGVVALPTTTFGFVPHRWGPVFAGALATLSAMAGAAAVTAVRN